MQTRTGRDGLQNARLHATSPSRTLRSHAEGRCRWCGNRIVWFDRYDGGRIPLTPVEFPKAGIPQRYRWTVSGGLAQPGSHGRLDQFCRIAHPAICPAAQHEDLDERLLPLLQSLGVLTQKMIRAGEFTPPPQSEAATEEAVQDAEPEAAPAADSRPVRHVIAWNDRLRIAPGPVDDLRCVAFDDNTQERCDRPVFDETEGCWQQIPLPPPATRRRTAAPRGAIWVWELTPLAYMDALRWVRQHCQAHHGSDATNAVAVEIVDFHPDRHAAYLTRTRPEGYQDAEKDTGAEEPSGPKRTTCASTDCHNATLDRRAPKGWLCWQCTRTAKRRVTTHRRWQSDPTSEQPARPWRRLPGQGDAP
ncbi:DUF6083 domain-containing protein [Kitasatospora sp. NPDC101801]|uniref:DUF6083 domain-containing protein n=1 Tax=Kitasatospora sp. NPDC101801 TaxID=3364103 RepID=UPI0038019662